jgi:methylmalonyl-CoA/ethylmalonyl-CoA epimerase
LVPVGRVERVRGFHHLGLAVTDLDEAIATYERLFHAMLEHREPLRAQGVEAASMLVGDGRVELVTPTGEDTPVGPGMHHVALRTDDLAATLDELESAGAQLIDRVPRQGLFGLEVAFVHPDSVHGVLTEVVASG